MVIVIILSVIILSLGIYYFFPLLQVNGTSMYPTLKEGNILLGSRIFNKKKIRIGEIVVYKSPVRDVEGKRRYFIKRVVGKTVHNNKVKYYCEGDNKNNSYDSRHYGFIPCEDIICKVIIGGK